MVVERDMIGQGYLLSLKPKKLNKNNRPQFLMQVSYKTKYGDIKNKDILISFQDIKITLKKFRYTFSLNRTGIVFSEFVHGIQLVLIYFEGGFIGLNMVDLSTGEINLFSNKFDYNKVKGIENYANRIWS